MKRISIDYQPADVIENTTIKIKQTLLTANFSDEKLKGSLPDKTFVFTPPKGTSKIEILPPADDTE